ncbi:tigger transposable element-derived protein 4-like [Ornithodoros turicata]|uniref:tigger transposable element-derived protein 4-like n=1 Tax=Ornithodoros turicata TaxID=34597 RepID=UPI00313A1DA2
MSPDRPPCAPKRRRIGITFASKAVICKRKKDNPHLKLPDIQQWAKSQLGLDIPKSTMADILSRSDKWLSADKENVNAVQERPGREGKLEEALLTWFGDLRSRGAPVNDMMLIEKAKIFGARLGAPDAFQFSRGWLHRFKQRHEIRQYTTHGEAASVDEAVVEAGKTAMRRTLQNFNRDDTYNMDETYLFYKLGPSSTLSTQAEPGTKKSKARITIALICNASGTDKQKPIVINNAARPRCFGKTFDPSVYCDYYHNKKAWMTTGVFQTIVNDLDRDLRRRNRRGVFVLDNASSHNATGLDLTNLELCFLPKDTTSHLQQLDAGIIRSFKSAYRRDLVSLFIERAEEGMEMTADILDAIRIVPGEPFQNLPL